MTVDAGLVPPPLSTREDDAAPTVLDAESKQESDALQATRAAAVVHPLERIGDTFAAKFPAGVLQAGVAYQIVMQTQDGQTIERRDPYARAVCWTQRALVLALQHVLQLLLIMQCVLSIGCWLYVSL